MEGEHASKVKDTTLRIKQHAGKGLAAQTQRATFLSSESVQTNKHEMNKLTE